VNSNFAGNAERDECLSFAESSRINHAYVVISYGLMPLTDSDRKEVKKKFAKTHARFAIFNHFFQARAAITFVFSKTIEASR